MKHFSYIVSKDVTIDSKTAGKITDATRKFYSNTYFFHSDRSADAKKIFHLIGLTVRPNMPTFVIVRGEDEVDASLALRECLEDCFPGMIRFPADSADWKERYRLMSAPRANSNSKK